MIVCFSPHTLASLSGPLLSSPPAACAGLKQTVAWLSAPARPRLTRIHCGLRLVLQQAPGLKGHVQKTDMPCSAVEPQCPSLSPYMHARAKVILCSHGDRQLQKRLDDLTGTASEIEP